jgi:5'-3' exonuclease
MILNSLRSYRQKFCHEYGEFIIACDGHNYWRKEFFPFYKANRKKFFEDSSLDWKLIFESFKKIKEEIKEYFPYKVLEIETAEADDIIGTLVGEYGYKKPDDPFTMVSYRNKKGQLTEPEKILIISSDKDFLQLMIYDNVTIYQPIKNLLIKRKD